MAGRVRILCTTGIHCCWLTCDRGLRAVIKPVSSLATRKRIDESECNAQEKGDEYGHDRHKQLASDDVACDIVTRVKAILSTSANVFGSLPVSAAVLAFWAAADPGH